MEKENHPYYIKSVSTPMPLVDAEEINSIEKWFLTILHVLENGEKGCFATNQYFAKKHKISVRQVQRILLKLLNLHYICIKFENSQPGKQKRFIKINEARFFGIEGTKEFLPVQSRCPGNELPGKCIEVQNNYNGRQSCPNDINATVTLMSHKKNSPATPLNKDVNTYTDCKVSKKIPILSKKDTIRTAQALPSTKIFFNKKENKFKNITKEKIEVWKKEFPKRDIESDLVKMENWLIKHPHRKGTKNFIENWFVRDMETKQNNPPTVVKDPETIEKEKLIHKIQKEGYFDLKITRYGVIDNFRGFDASFKDPNFEERVMHQWEKIKQGK